MQYALMKLDKGKFLIDAHELIYINNYIDSGKIIQDSPPEDEDNLKHKLVYGCYFQQIDRGYTEQDINDQINFAINKWLVHLADDSKVIYLGIDDIEIIQRNERRLMFAALISAPEEFIINQKKQAKTVYLRLHNLDLLTNLVNREGLFALGMQESLDESVVLTKENWRQYIDFNKAIKRCSTIV